jgi:hypothetical protein
VPTVLLAAAGDGIADLVRLRFELALVAGLACAWLTCRRTGLLPTTLVAATTWLGAAGFLLLEMAQIDLHVRAGGGERLVFGLFLADAPAALGKAWIVSVLGAALGLAALGTGGRGRDVDRILLSALLASFAVSAADLAPALGLIALAHLASRTRERRRPPLHELLGAAAPLVCAGVALLVTPHGSVLGGGRSAGGSLSASEQGVAIGLWIAAFAAFELRVASAAAHGVVAPGAPRFWRELGLRLAVLSFALRLAVALAFERASGASSFVSASAARDGVLLAAIGLALAGLAHVRQLRAADLTSWSRATLAAGAALVPLALLAPSGAALRSAAAACCALAVQGALLHAAQAIARRVPGARSPWWLAAAALLVGLPLPTLLGDHARRAAWEAACDRADPVLAILMAAELLLGLAAAGLGWQRLRRQAAGARDGAVERAELHARWPAAAAGLLLAAAAACSALAGPIDARLRSGRLDGIGALGSADDFLGRRYERAPRASSGASRSASSSAVLRSVPGPRQPTMRAHGTW